MDESQAAPSTAETEPVLLLVTGMSGAGRSTALKILEDFGFDAVDNLPLSLLPRMAAGSMTDGALRAPTAVGVDVRNRDFSVDEFLKEARVVRDQLRCSVLILFLDCDDEVLIRRYAETRRKHPLAADRPVADGLALERRLLGALRDSADIVLDTSDSNIWELKRKLGDAFDAGAQGRMTVAVTSFSYRLGVPRDADLVFDVRFLRNPHYEPALRDQTGRSPAVAAYIAEDRDYAAFWDRLIDLLDVALPRYREEGKSYLTIAFGCTGGKHRSVHFAERLSQWLREGEWSVTLSHRDAPGGAASPTERVAESEGPR